MSDPHQMPRMITGAWVSQMMYVVAKLGLADLIAEKPQTAEALAKRLDLHGPSLYRLLRALASLGVFEADEAGEFRATPLSETLREDVPGSMKALAIMMGEEHYRCWGELLYSIKTGNKAFDHLYQQPIFEYLSKNPEAARTFDAAMTSVHGRESDPMAESYDFSQFDKVVDIGGGNGSLLMAILSRHTNVKGIVYDLPGVIERTRANIAKAGFSDRIELIEGNFFEAIPTGADCYLMRHIIHDWTDAECGTILANCHTAMSDEATLLVAESVIPEGNEPFFGKLLDLTMLLLPGGKERTEDEYRTLFEANGFNLTGTISTGTEVSYLEGRIAKS